ncbi:MAG TPA: biotin/lipoyl-binding protein [Mucilaginibacter sp.]|jgi:multidrug efflux pump subunit AcrA (membrane-fusion protein)|nr:biotin/lipoyl-binding protein [Mucilaginibacter sp.]
MDNKTEQRHTEEIQDIIGVPPVWLIRWGISGFFLVLVAVLSLSEIIRYPDTVKAQLKIRLVNPPKYVEVTTSGKLVKLFVQNNGKVKEGQILAVIETATGSTTLTAPKSGRLAYAGIIHENQVLLPHQYIFFINDDNETFFGEMQLPQNTIGKVKENQDVMIKLRTYPYEEYGILHGKIKYITSNPFKDDEYIAEVDFKAKNLTDMRKRLALRNGMLADADIITQNQSLLKRLTSSIFKDIKL